MAKKTHNYRIRVTGGDGATTTVFFRGTSKVDALHSWLRWNDHRMGVRARVTRIDAYGNDVSAKAKATGDYAELKAAYRQLCKDRDRWRTLALTHESWPCGDCGAQVPSVLQWCDKCGEVGYA